MDYKKELEKLEKEFVAKRDELKLEFKYYKRYGLDNSVYQWKGNNTVMFGDINKEQFKQIVRNATLKSGYQLGDNNKTFINSAYKLTLRNNINNRELNIDIHTVDEKLSMNLDVHEIAPFVLGFNRKVYDTETHYFGGVCATDIRKMQIPALTFKYGETVGWYGGDKTLIDVDRIKEIINHLLK